MPTSIPRRFLAFFLDGIFLGVLGVIASHLIPILGGMLIWFFYGPILECSQAQATLGKHVLGIQVTDLQGRRITFRASLLRNIMKTVSSLLLCLGHAVALFTEKKQALQDLTAETLVVDGKAEVALVDAWIASVKAVFGSSAGALSADSVTKLERLQKLKEAGTLTEEEFQAEKRKILSGD